jgi:hypothetical protein
MGECIMMEVLDFLGGLILVALFIAISWSIILHNKNEYDKMNKEVEKNDSSRIG